MPPIITGLAFVVLFLDPATLLVRDWWTNPEAGHGLLLAPVAGWLAWKKGWVGPASPSVGLGLLILVGAVLLRTVSELAAELFTMRFSMVAAAVGLVVYYRGVRQALAWWLPFVLLALAIPLPELVTSTIALPLQFRASRMGAALLEWRQVPVRLTGNVIEIPGNRLFVTEACSGLRSLTALLSIGFLMGGLWLHRFWSRALLIALAIPIAVVINGVRVFLTGFLVYFVDPKMGEGFMHMTEGWLLFLVSLVLIGVAAAVLALIEKRISVARAT
ncbi:MAG TPA: exosortase/archaeosortase family protein [Gemmatimonadales bacterium]|nr:exosortase/archaeosortase family protein [Gemmatimonadales bacterium]